MESLGMLAGGIAHDFNNLLAAIMGNTELTQRSLPAEAPEQKNLRAVLEATRRPKNLTSQMLAYTGAIRLEARRVDLNELLQEVRSSTHRLLPENIEVQWSASGDLPPVEVDAEQIQQVIAALLTNAVEAIGQQKASVRLTTSLCSVEPDQVAPAGQPEPLEPGLYVVLEVGRFRTSQVSAVAT